MQQPSSVRTVSGVDVSISSTGPSQTAVSPTVDLGGPAQRAVDPVAPGHLHSKRLTALVDLIQSLTGRQVKLVPPAAYLVSKPAEAHPPIEVVAPTGLISELGEGAGTIEIGISSVLRTGTSARMLLEADDTGALQLRATDLEL